MFKGHVVSKISTAFLMLALLVLPQLSYADWSIGIGIGDGDHHRDDRFHDRDHGFYGWHDHPHYGWHVHFLPAGYFTIWAGGVRYYYYDGLYYTYVGHGDYVLVNPPIGAYVNAIPSDFQAMNINGRIYYTNNGVYYILTEHHGYKVVPTPVIYAQPQQVVVAQPVTTVEAAPAVVSQDAFPVNVPNNNGGYTAVIIKKSGNGFVGPQGEYYTTFPSVTQLKAMYGK
jgi:hypothetical protein